MWQWWKKGGNRQIVIIWAHETTQNDIKYDHTLFDQGECSFEMVSTAATWEAAAPLSSDLFEAQGGGHDGRYGGGGHGDR